MSNQEQDLIYCYPNSDCLINKFDIKDPHTLFEMEAMLSAARLLDLYKKPLLGSFNAEHLKRIHKYIFSDCYRFAGEFRLVNISKGNLFCDARFIKPSLDKLFHELKNENFLKNLPYTQLMQRAAYYLGEINAIHPFREGNGRAQREFIRELLLNCGYHVDYSRCEPKMMLYASINAYSGDLKLMTELFNLCTRKIEK